MLTWIYGFKLFRQRFQFALALDIQVQIAAAAKQAHKRILLLMIRDRAGEKRKSCSQAHIQQFTAQIRIGRYQPDDPVFLVLLRTHAGRQIADT